jgi:hypothetical protein
VLIGHFEPNRGWVVDASVAKTLSASTDYTVGVVLRGSSVSVTVNGAFALSWGFNAPVVDGGMGVLTQNGTTSFDVFRIRTNDPAFATSSTTMVAAMAMAPTSAMSASLASPVTTSDVSGDGKVTPLDALILINAINNQSGFSTNLLADPGTPQYDVDGDSILSPRDVLIVVNELNAAADSIGLAEGEAVQGIAFRREPSADERLELYSGLEQYDVDDELAQGVSDQWRLGAGASKTDDEPAELRALSRLAVDEALDELLQGV